MSHLKFKRTEGAKTFPKGGTMGDREFMETGNLWTMGAREFMVFPNCMLRFSFQLEYINIILRILAQRSNLLNYFIILGKIYLWIAAKIKKSLSLCLSKMWSKENIKLKSL